jgi:hypothetical protein
LPLGRLSAGAVVTGSDLDRRWGLRRVVLVAEASGAWSWQIRVVSRCGGSGVRPGRQAPRSDIRVQDRCDGCRSIRMRCEGCGAGLRTAKRKVGAAADPMKCRPMGTISYVCDNERCDRFGLTVQRDGTAERTDPRLRKSWRRWRALRS